MGVVRVYQYGDRLRFVELKSTHEKVLDVAAFLSDTSRLDLDCSNDMDEDNGERMINNISRAKSSVRELAFCNPWEHFVTITVSSENQDRSNLKLFKQRFNQCIKDYNDKYSTSLKYLIVPELHADKRNWHMHGLMMNIAQESISVNNNGFPTIPYFEKRFGWVSIDPIRDRDKTASYVTKYISKDLAAHSHISKGDHLYLCSRGLQRAELIWQDGMLANHVKFDFENDYVRIAERKMDFEDFFMRYEQKLAHEGDILKSGENML